MLKFIQKNKSKHSFDLSSKNKQKTHYFHTFSTKLKNFYKTKTNKFEDNKNILLTERK